MYLCSVRTLMDYDDPICALSTPPGVGALAMVRLTGAGCVERASPFFRFPGGRRLTSLQANETRYALFAEDDETIDEVMVTVYRPPHSYTGEEMVEITCHGSQYIQQRILQALIAAGIRTARPGEFTLRAFLNGRLDLARAEAVADLIAARSAAAHRLALSQLQGKVSEEIGRLREQLLHFAVMIELENDFGEEEVEFADREELIRLASGLLQRLHDLAATFREGNLMKHGIPVVIAGAPNTGKSTLLNTLVQEEKAIVSEIPGTTRDLIEESFQLDGFLFRFIDTAGLREDTHDRIEKIGIERTYKKLREATVILLVADWQQPPEEILRQAAAITGETDLSRQHLIPVINKCDTAPEEKLKELKSALGELPAPPVFISARTEQNISQLKARLKEVVHLSGGTDQEVIISNARHHEALLRAAGDIKRVVRGLRQGLSSDLVALDLRQAIHHLGEITGKITTDEILGNIFERFCIGK